MDEIKVLISKEEAGDIFCFPLTFNNIRNCLIKYINTHEDILDRNIKNDDMSVISALSDKIFNSEDKDNLIVYLAFIDKSPINMLEKYATIMGLLKTAMSNTKILTMDPSEVLAISSAFTEISVYDLEKYHSLLANIDNLKDIMSDGKTEDEKRRFLIAKMMEFEEYYNDKSSKKI